MSESQVGPPTDDELLARCRGGEAAAFAELVKRHALEVGRLIGCLVDDPDLVAGLVQETFVRAHRGLASHRGGRIGAWLARIAVNVVRDGRRYAWFSPVDEPESAVRRGMAGLPPKLGEPARLRFLAGESYETIGHLLELPERTVRVRAEAALNRLRVELGERSERCP